MLTCPRRDDQRQPEAAGQEPFPNINETDHGRGKEQFTGTALSRLRGSTWLLHRSLKDAGR